MEIEGAKAPQWPPDRKQSLLMKLFRNNDSNMGVSLNGGTPKWMVYKAGYFLERWPLYTCKRSSGAPINGHISMGNFRCYSPTTVTGRAHLVGICGWIKRSVPHRLPGQSSVVDVPLRLVCCCT